jgi:hypothetical protein
LKRLAVLRLRGIITQKSALFMATAVSCCRVVRTLQKTNEEEEVDDKRRRIEQR